MIQGVPQDSSFSNNIVAQSDYEAAIRAIEATFQQEQPNLNNHSDDDPLVREIFESAQASLLRNLSRMVQPMNDNDYHGLIDPYHIVQEDDDDDDESVLEDSPQVEEQDDEDEEIDEEDLLDTRALQEAQELRSQVRALSKRVQQIRERVLQRESQTVENPDSRVHVVGPSMVSNDDDDDDSLKSSLEQLSQLLHHSQWAKLPKQMQSLQDTIEVIQKEQQTGRTLSQTEVAIISRNNSTEEDEHLRLPSSSHEEGDDLLSASDRLVQFFQNL
jgi:hypothetical protein